MIVLQYRLLWNYTQIRLFSCQNIHALKRQITGDWAEMTMLMNSVVLNALRHLSHTIRDKLEIFFKSDI